MPALTKQPKNPNFLGKLHFQLVLKRAPNLVYFGSASQLPAITLDTIEQHTPLITIPRPGTKITYDDFEYTFRVDEDFANYLEIYNWMNDLGFPDDFTGYPRLTSGEGVVSDGTLITMSSAKNPNVSIRFRDMFPYHVSALDFNVGENDIQYVECTATFKYQRFYIDKL